MRNTPHFPFPIERANFALGDSGTVTLADFFPDLAPLSDGLLVESGQKGRGQEVGERR